ncbi:hypothetical protein JXB11_04140 [Candidatus Woesearchaeota archaeon]|nr:hypothetical protein [Candidatus Woesearchaeota archaeon]
MLLSKKGIREIVKKHYLKAILIVAALLALSLLFNTSIKSLIVIAVFIVIGTFSTFYFNYVRVPIHFETVKLGTILCAVAYGFYPALIVGLVSTFFGKVLIGRIDERLPISMIGITLVAVFAALFSSANIATLGVVLVLCYNIYIFLMALLLHGNMAWVLSYEGSNFLFNLLWFTRIAPFLLPAIQ